jgi:MoxR-like ATPase
MTQPEQINQETRNAPSELDRIPSELVSSISSVLIGKQDQVKHLVVALLAGGHVLIEDIPGVGKTLLALATAGSIGAGFRRIQFTSDTLPSDVIGVNVYDPKSSEFTFREGPIFTEVLLADEINRTSPRTQSALLEAMAEGKVSVDGVTRVLAGPFLVLATMNPVERFGSFELPESQMDRFMMSVSLGYPDRDHEREILQRDMEHRHAEELPAVTDPATIRILQKRVRRVSVEESVAEYLLDVLRATRRSPAIRLGLSSRGGLHLKRCMQALALLEGRDYVIPEDLRRIFLPVAVHRILVSGTSASHGVKEQKEEALDRILQTFDGPM